LFPRGSFNRLGTTPHETEVTSSNPPLLLVWTCKKKKKKKELIFIFYFVRKTIKLKELKIIRVKGGMLI